MLAPQFRQSPYALLWEKVRQCSGRWSQPGTQNIFEFRFRRGGRGICGSPAASVPFAEASEVSRGLPAVAILLCPVAELRRSVSDIPQTRGSAPAIDRAKAARAASCRADGLDWAA